MIPRRLSHIVQNRLQQFPAVALLGPRQAGKTTLARLLDQKAVNKQPTDYLDLENPADLEKLEDASGYLRHRRGRLMIIAAAPQSDPEPGRTPEPAPGTRTLCR